MTAKTAAACRLLVVEDDSAIRGVDAAGRHPPNVVIANVRFPGAIDEPGMARAVDESLRHPTITDADGALAALLDHDSRREPLGRSLAELRSTSGRTPRALRRHDRDDGARPARPGRF